MAILRLLVFLLPRRIRRPFGEAILETYREGFERRRATKGWAEAVAFFLATMLDLAGTVVREQWRDMRGAFGGARAPGRRRGRKAIGAELWSDVRLSARSLRKAPGFSVVVVVLVALGIGANTSIFTALKAVLLSPPPFPDPASLVMVDLTEAPAAPVESGAPPRAMLWSYLKYRVLEEQPDRQIASVAAFGGRWGVLLDDAGPVRVRMELVSPGYFGVLGLTPALGRTFTTDENDPDAPPMTAIISHRVWRQRFGEDAAVLGRAIDLNDRRVEIVGVAPPGFLGLTGEVDAWVPIASSEPLFNRFMVRSAQSHWLQVVGRLGPGETLDRTRSGMDAVGQRIEAAYPGSDPTVVRGASARTFAEARRNPTATTSLLALGGAALMVLLITCANLAGLLMARAPLRLREMAVRKALGAGRLRLIRRLSIESLLVAGVGGALGLALARFGVAAMAAYWPSQFANSSMANLRVVDASTFGLDAGVLAVGAVLTVVTGLVFGLAPAFALTRHEIGHALRAGGSLDPGAGTRVTRAGGWGRSTLVAFETALALVLVVGAGLMIGSLERLTAVEYGYDGSDVLSFSVALPRGGASAANPLAFRETLLDDIAAVPGVVSVAASCTMPLSGHCSITGVRELEGQAPFPEGSRPAVGLETVSDDYFQTLGVPLLAGRTFTTADGRDSAPVVVINETAARTLFPDEDPVGRTMRIGYFSEADGLVQVVGVVGDVLYSRPEQGVMSELYVSFRQDGSAERIVLRADREPTSLLPAVRERVLALEPRAVIYGETTGAEAEARATADTRTVMSLLALFASLAVGLAGAGIWGIVSYSVSGRRKELGLRMALGARHGEVETLVLMQGIRAAVYGVVLGIPAALVLTRLLSSLLFGLDPWDVATYGSGGAFLLAVTAIAAWVPARRAGRIDPMIALRTD